MRALTHWTAEMAEKAARDSGPLSKEEIEVARQLLRGGRHLSWAWAFRLIQMVADTESEVSRD